jgi:hypothetical protein
MVLPLQRLLTQLDEEIGVARQAAAAVTADRELSELRRDVDQLRKGLASRAVIERAKGILMQREGVSESRVFDLLNKLSQRRHRKLRDVAADIANGRLPPCLSVVPAAAMPPGTTTEHARRQRRVASPARTAGTGAAIEAAIGTSVTGPEASPKV